MSTLYIVALIDHILHFANGLIEVQVRTENLMFSLRVYCRADVGAGDGKATSGDQCLDSINGSQSGRRETL